MQTAFHDFPANAFPITLELLNRNGVVVWSAEVDEPGALYVPPVANLHGPCGSRVRFADGQVAIEPPPGGWVKRPA